jgi:hypothetical protein
LFALEIAERLFDEIKKRQLVNNNGKSRRGNSTHRHEARVRFHLWKKRKGIGINRMEAWMGETSGETADVRSVTRCHHVAFSGSSTPQVMFFPYASRVLYS